MQDPLTPPSSWHYQHWQANKPMRRHKHWKISTNSLITYEQTHAPLSDSMHPKMILNVHSYMSHLSARYARSRSAGHLFLGRKPHDKHPKHLNGAIWTLCHILKFVAASTEEAELGSLLLNAKKPKPWDSLYEKLDTSNHPLLYTATTPQQQALQTALWSRKT